MARIVQDVRLAKREQRSRLAPQRKPYWLMLNEGEHLGYYRGSRVGKWVARYRQAGSAGNYLERTLGEADDAADADGAVILNFREAQEIAREWFAFLDKNDGRRPVKYTVSNALDDYLAQFSGKDVTNTVSRIEAFIRPQLGDFEATMLTTKDIVAWHMALAQAPARLRTKPGAKQNIRETPDIADAKRRRRSTANRILTVLKAALNVAYRDGKAPTDDAWRRVKPFAKADAAKLRYLSDEEARRLVNGCDPSFRPLVQAALLTGARYSELTRLEARDFDRHSRTLWLRETKSGVARAVYLEEEGVRLFDVATAGKLPCASIFPRPDGKPWGSSQQARPLSHACAVAQLEPTGFHDLRRTYGARMALRGVPMAVIAEALGHADERITRRHYAHLSNSYVADTVRSAVAGLGIVQASNVVRL